MSLKQLLRSFFGSIPPAGDIKLIRDQLYKFEVDLHTTAVINLKNTLENHPRYGDPKRLLKYASQVSSQNEEDGMIHEIFRRIKTTNRVFAEVGIGDGSENNTAFLLSQGWTGFWVDGNDSFLKNISKRPDLGNNCIQGVSAFLTKDNAESIFTKLGVPVEFDLLSLDIDQNTFYLWEGLKKYRPRVVIVEYNASLPPDVDWKVNYDPRRVWDGTNNFGASLKAFELLGRQLGYSLVGCDYIGANAFFVRDELVADHFAGPFTAENHHEPARFALIHRNCHPQAILDRAPKA